MRAAKEGSDILKKNESMLSATDYAKRIVNRMERSREHSDKLIVTVDNSTADIARAIHSLSDADLVRLKALARLWTRGLPGSIGWADVLHEAIARVLEGSRKWPPSVPILVFLSGVMRSICEDHWRRTRRDTELFIRDEDLGDLSGSDEEGALACPERVVAAAQCLAALDRLFAADAFVLKIIAGLAEGLTSTEICELYSMSEREYDAARKRMRRTLLRCGLEWSGS